jgi:hypothetical protein
VDLPLGRFVSFYPRFTLGIESTHSERQVIHGKSASVATAFVASPSNTQTGPWVALFAPLLLHPAPHVVVGAGPSFFHEFGRVAGAQDVGGERTTLGGRITIGAWWGGAVASPEEAAPATTPAATEPRFGDARHFVLDGLAGAGFTYSFHNGTASNTTNVFINPGFDYFVASQVSLGLGVSTDYTKTNGVQPSGAAVTYETTGIGVTPRIGVNIPISAALSFYPRATLFAGTRSYDESSGASGINYSVYIVNLGIYAPLLVHVASHAFIGIGPYVNHDLTAKLANGLVGPENLATRAGASVLVGGWL